VKLQNRVFVISPTIDLWKCY